MTEIKIIFDFLKFDLELERIAPVESSAVPVEAAPLKSVPASVQVPVDESVQAAVQSPVVAPAVQAPAEAEAVATAVSPAKSVPESSESPAVVEQKVESQLSQNSSELADATKAEPSTSSKKKFSFGPLKKVGPIRLVNGFRSPHLRPRIQLDSQKEVADNVREWLYERRNKYEKFVDNVLGKANPIGAKQPAPGADSSANDAAAAAAVLAAADASAGGAVGIATTPATPPITQRDPSGKWKIL